MYAYFRLSIIVGHVIAGVFGRNKYFMNSPTQRPAMTVTLKMVISVNTNSAGFSIFFKNKLLII